jgi:putative ABC transport system ATP-binding protein
LWQCFFWDIALAFIRSIVVLIWFMIISLHKVVPAPIREKVLSRESDLWNSELSLQQGEWIKVKAPSGTGKTTLMHIIWNLRKDFEGRVEYDGQPVDTIDAETLALYRQTRMSIIFQDLRLFGQLSALENIELKLKMPHQPLYGIDKVEAMAEQLGVSHVLHQQTSTCSYGEQQRIAIIRALVQPFEWLLMDEPFSHLDKANAQKAAQLINDECQSRGAGLLITDLDEDELFPYHKHLNL